MPKARKPVLHNGILRLDPNNPQGAAINLEGAGWADWQQWLARNLPFVYTSAAGHFTAQAELRRNHAYWYGYRRRAGKLHKVYLGRAQDLQPAHLEAANNSLAGLHPSPSHPFTPTPPPSARLAWARLSPPALPARLVERPRLTTRVTAPLTLIYAPSGYGKSTLLNEWRRDCLIPVAWVTLSEADNQPLRFWLLVLRALHSALEQNTAPLPDWQVTSEDDIPYLLDTLTDQLIQAFGPHSPAHAAIVLDEYQHIRNPSINSALQRWLEHWPSALQLVLAGHIKPPLAVGTLRARGFVTELDADDLRFTLEEGVQFLHRHQPAHAPLLRRDLETLVQRTKGWPAGLTLAAMALARQPDVQSFLDSFSGAHVYLSEYFLENVLEQQAADVQEFLLKTAILRQLNGSLCDAVTGRDDSAELLVWLWQENLFLVQLEQAGAYQYHTMFAEALQGELQRRMAAAIPDLHRRAAEWHRRRHAIDDAVHHLFAIGAWEEAATLIEEIAVAELTEFGEDSRLLRWLRQLPAATVQQHRTLLLLYLRLAHIGLDPGEVQRFLDAVAGRLQAKSAAERSNDEEEVLAEIERMRRQQPGGAAAVRGGPHETVWQHLAALGDAMHTYPAQQPGGEMSLSRRIYEAALAENNLFVVLLAGSNCISEAILNGQLRRGRQLGEELLRVAHARRQTLPEPASITLTHLASIHLERNQLDSCEQLLLRAREIDPNPTSTNMLISTAILTARLQAARREPENAQRTLHEARELHARRPSAVWSDQDILAYAARCALCGNNAPLAQALLESGSADPHALSDQVRAELFLLGGQPDDAATLLHALLDQYPLHPQREPQIRTRILLALAAAAQQQMHKARSLLTAIIHAAAPEEFVRPFLDYAGLLAPLLGLVLQQEKLGAEERHFVRRLIGLMGHRPPPENRLPAADPLAAAITAREQQVLSLLAAGRTNAEIAADLMIAESTVKTHLANIYVKLRVRNRAAAVAWHQALTHRAGWQPAP